MEKWKAIALTKEGLVKMILFSATVFFQTMHTLYSGTLEWFSRVVGSYMISDSLTLDFNYYINYPPPPTPAECHTRQWLGCPNSRMGAAVLIPHGLM